MMAKSVGRPNGAWMSERDAVTAVALTNIAAAACLAFDLSLAGGTGKIIFFHVSVVVTALCAAAALLAWERKYPWYPPIPISGPGGFFGIKWILAIIWAAVAIYYVAKIAHLLGWG